MVADAGAAANLVCFRWLEHQNRLLEKMERRKASTYPSATGFRCGDGRLRDVRRAANIPVGIAEGQGKPTAFVLSAEIPA